MQITKQAIVNAPAGEVWRVVAHEFDRIGSWATAVSASHEVTDAVPAAGRAVGGRACHTTMGLFPVVEERIVAYDEAARTLTYEPVRGMPAFMAGARSTWWVVAVDDRRSRVSFTATVNIRGVAAPIMRLAMRLQIGRAGDRGLDDLRHYVEHGRPSPRKQRRLDRHYSRMATFESTRVVRAPRDRVWEVISDAAALAAHAPNLSASEVVEGSGDGMIRRCYNNAGEGWSETCTRWEPGHRYTMEVDTTDYPYPLRTMRGTWAIEDDPRGTRIRLRYEYEPKYGLAGRVLAVLMRPAFASTCRDMLDSYEAALGLPATLAARGSA